MTEWTPIEGTGYPDQEAEVAWPFYAQAGPEGDSTTGAWSWTLLRANRDGTQAELTGGTADSEGMAKMLAEAAGLGALAQYETAEPGETAYHEHWRPGEQLVKHSHPAGRTPHEHEAGSAQ